MTLDKDGFEMVPSGLSSACLGDLRHALSCLPFPAGKAGIRHVDQRLPQVLQLASNGALFDLAALNLGPSARLVRAIYFDKSQGRNWLVTWHQDKTIVADRSTVPGHWGPWSKKDGEWHVQPPAEVLNQMLTLRLHLDDATAENGALKAIPGTHRQGVLPQSRINEVASGMNATTCMACCGDVLLMKPLLLHASGKAVSDSPRRILHLEFGVYHFPG